MNTVDDSLRTALVSLRWTGVHSLKTSLSLLPLSALLAIGLAVPMGIFFVYGFWRSDIFGVVREWNFDQYRAVASDPFARALLLRTVLLAATIASVCTVIGYVVAYALTFSIRRGRNAILLLIAISTLASYLVRIYAWKTILGPDGVINSGLNSIGVISEPLTFLLFGKFAVILVLVQILLPFAILPIYAAMQSVDRSMLEASRDLGGGPIVTFFRTTLPLTVHGAAVAFVLTFILAAGDYVTPLLVGGQGSALLGRLIYLQFGFSQNWSLASALAVSLLVCLAAFLALLCLVAIVARKLAKRYRVRTYQGPRSDVSSRLWRALPLGKLVVGGVVAFLFAPIAVMIVFSFNTARFARFPLEGLTLEWYRGAFSNEAVLDGLITSVQLSALVVAVALAVSLPAAYVLARRRFRGKSIVATAAILPVAVPGMILGFSIFGMFRLIELEPSLWSAGLGQAVFVVPFVLLVVEARLRRFDWTLEEAGRDLGATASRVFVRISWPIVWPPIVASALLAFALAMDEFIITRFTIGEQETLPVVIWSLMSKRGIDPSINAIGSVVMALSTLLAVAVAGISIWRARQYRMALSQASGGSEVVILREL